MPGSVSYCQIPLNMSCVWLPMYQQCVRGPVSPQPCQKNVVVKLLNFWQSVRYGMVSQCSFNVHFLMIKQVGLLFMFKGHLCILTVNFVFLALAYFSVKVLVFFFLHFLKDFFMKESSSLLLIYYKYCHLAFNIGYSILTC